jgi:hypothetical protein
MVFDFEVTFPCNGVYDATATATLDDPLGQQDSIELKSINVAVPPQQPASFLATDTGNHTVELSWTGPNDSPPDLAGYRLSRRDATGATFGVLGTTTPSVFAFTDSNIPATGGSYFYRIETMRTAPGGTQLASVPVTTGQALVVDATPGSVPGNSGGGGGGGSTPADGAPATAPTGGDQHFDETTLAADEGEPGANDPVAALPGGDTIQRFAGHDGAGLVKPFAAALDIAVWAGLLLFLTRRAAGAERAAALVVELEHPT